MLSASESTGLAVLDLSRNNSLTNKYIRSYTYKVAVKTDTLFFVYMY